MFTDRSKGTIKFLIYAEEVSTKNILRVRDLEESILCPRAMATFASFAITLFSNIFFNSFTVQRGGLKG